MGPGQTQAEVRHALGRSPAKSQSYNPPIAAGADPEAIDRRDKRLVALREDYSMTGHVPGGGDYLWGFPLLEPVNGLKALGDISDSMANPERYIVWYSPAGKVVTVVYPDDLKRLQEEAGRSKAR